MRATPESGYEPDYAVPPGETLKEKAEQLEMDQRELATRLALSAKHVNRIIKGHATITHETAIRLERVTGIARSFWLNREAIYRERLARIEEIARLKSDLAWIRTVPVSELVKRGVIEPTKDKAQRLRDVLSFFGVSSTDAWRNYWQNASVAARRSKCFETHLPALATWLRLGEIEAQKIVCKPYERVRFRKTLHTIRKLTTSSPDTLVERMKNLCARSGVAFVLIREMKKVPWHGASWWQTPRKAVIELNLRGKSEDQFWFSFFHEAGHIVKGHSTKEIFINDEGKEDPREDEANRFAAELLIPKARACEIPRLRDKADMLRFAREIAISPGIVAGQYQRMTQRYRLRWVHDLKRKFKWAE